MIRVKDPKKSLAFYQDVLGELECPRRTVAGPYFGTSALTHFGL